MGIMEDMYGKEDKKKEEVKVESRIKQKTKVKVKKHREHKRKRFEGEEKKGFEFKPIYIVGLLIVVGIAYIMFFSGEKVEPLPPAPPPAPISSDNPSGSGSGDTSNTSKTDTKTDQLKTDPNSIYIQISKINDGKAHYYEPKSSTGKTIRFFVLKSSDGVFRAAFDACDVCYREKKGYRQEGDYMVCNNCGMKFPSTKINDVEGGCNPAPLIRHMEDANYNEVGLDSWTDDGYLMIKKSDIETGAKYF